MMGGWRLELVLVLLGLAAMSDLIWSLMSPVYLAVGSFYERLDRKGSNLKLKRNFLSVVDTRHNT